MLKIRKKGLDQIIAFIKIPTVVYHLTSMDIRAKHGLEFCHPQWR